MLFIDLCIIGTYSITFYFIGLEVGMIMGRIGGGYAILIPILVKHFLPISTFIPAIFISGIPHFLSFILDPLGSNLYEDSYPQGKLSFLA